MSRPASNYWAIKTITVIDYFDQNEVFKFKSLLMNFLTLYPLMPLALRRLNIPFNKCVAFSVEFINIHFGRHNENSEKMLKNLNKIEIYLVLDVLFTFYITYSTLSYF